MFISWLQTSKSVKFYIRFYLGALLENIWNCTLTLFCAFICNSRSKFLHERIIKSLLNMSHFILINICLSAVNDQVFTDQLVVSKK